MFAKSDVTMFGHKLFVKNLAPLFIFNNNNLKKHKKHLQSTFIYVLSMFITIKLMSNKLL